MKLKRKTILAIAWVMLALPFVVLMSACAAPPTPLKTGAETLPPHGCIEYRQRGGKC